MSIEPLLFDYDDAAEIIGIVSAEWLSKHKNELPHTEMGRKIGFSMEQCLRIIQMFAVEPAVVRKPATVPGALLDLKPERARARLRSTS